MPCRSLRNKLEQTQEQCDGLVARLALHEQQAAEEVQQLERWLVADAEVGCWL